MSIFVWSKVKLVRIIYSICEICLGFLYVHVVNTDKICGYVCVGCIH